MDYSAEEDLFKKEYDTNSRSDVEEFTVGEVFFTEKRKIFYRCHCCSHNYFDALQFEAHLVQTNLGENDEEELTNIDVQEELEEDFGNMVKCEEARDEDDTVEIIEVYENVELFDDPEYEFEETDIAYDEDKSQNEEHIFIEEDEEQQESLEIQPELKKIKLIADNAKIKPEGETLLQALQRLREFRNATVGKSKKHSKNSLECKKCDFVAATDELLKQHKNSEHPASNETMYKCEICDSQFNQKFNLRAHMKRHSAENKKFCCCQCGAKFHTKTELSTHERRHNGIKPFTCDKCGKSYATSGQLSEHKRREMNERPYACELCEKSYKGRGELKKHMVVHTNERNYVCEYCNARFGRNNAYKNHLKLHLNAKEYVCEYCSVAFNQRPALITHLKAKHNTKLTKITQNNEQ